jgi:hypothetical protein
LDISKKQPLNGCKIIKYKYLILSIFRKKLLKIRYKSKKNEKKNENQFKEKRIQNIIQNIFAMSTM